MLLTWGLIIVLAIVIAIIVRMYGKNDLEFIIPVIIFSFVFVAAGVVYGIVATTEIKYYDYEIIRPEQITKSDDVVFVQFKDFKTQEYDSKKEYDNIDSTTIFLLKKSYNYYNFEINHPVIEYYYDKKETEKLLNIKVYD